MGLMLSIVSRFRKRATTREVLDGIDEDIKRLESTFERNQKLQKKIVLSLLIFSFILYFAAVAIFYFLLLPDNWSERAIWILPFAIFPAVIYFLKRCFHFIFVTRIKRIGQEIECLNERKKKILDDVTENETYKVAKELLEKFDPKCEIIKRDFAIRSPTPMAQRMSPPSSHQGELRHRANAAVMKNASVKQLGSNSLPSTPVHNRMNQSSQVVSPVVSPGVVQPVRAVTPHPVNSNGLPSPLPGTAFQGASLRKYPILPKERSTFDKVAEYFIGDGPSYRYALICKYCYGHNGMALKDEFEYIAFRCCYCGAPNPARKSRPNAPTLEDARLSDHESDKEKVADANEQSKDGENTVQEKLESVKDSVGRHIGEETNDSSDTDDGNNEHASDSIKSKLE